MVSGNTKEGRTRYRVTVLCARARDIEAAWSDVPQGFQSYIGPTVSYQGDPGMVRMVPEADMHSEHIDHEVRWEKLSL